MLRYQVDYHQNLNDAQMDVPCEEQDARVCVIHVNDRIAQTTDQHFVHADHEADYVSSPIAKDLLDVFGVQAVMVSPYYVVLVKAPVAGGWSAVEARAAAVLQEHLYGSATPQPEKLPQTRRQPPRAGNFVLSTPIVLRGRSPIVIQDRKDLQRIASNFRHGTASLAPHIGTLRSLRDAARLQAERAHETGEGRVVLDPLAAGVLYEALSHVIQDVSLLAVASEFGRREAAAAGRAEPPQ